jgi:hypothetical protein
MKEIFRFDNYAIVKTHCDPKIDLLSWFSGLRSKGYTADLLRSVHNFHNAREIQICSKAIASHAEHAVELIKQGIIGSPEISFLSLYYGTLDIAKICIICNQMRSELLNQRTHGASCQFPSKRFPDFMKANIAIKTSGAIPLFYKSLTQKELASREVRIQNSEILQFIRMVGHEMNEIYQVENNYTPVRCYLEENSTNISLVVKFLGEHPFSILTTKAFLGFQKTDNLRCFQTRQYSVNDITANAIIQKHLKRWLLIYDMDSNNNPVNLTINCRRRFVFPEEFAILLILFYLSNIVRYHPEYLNFLRDSRAWTLISVLQNHSLFSYLNTCWSIVKKKGILFQTV